MGLQGERIRYRVLKTMLAHASGVHAPCPVSCVAGSSFSWYETWTEAHSPSATCTGPRPGAHTIARIPTLAAHLPRLAPRPGDEVVDPATRPLGPGQIRDANRAMLLAAAARAGAEPLDLGVARDAEGHLEGCLAAAVRQGVDVLVTSGGCGKGQGGHSEEGALVRSGMLGAKGMGAGGICAAEWGLCWWPRWEGWVSRARGGGAG